jgi:signal transduction histidine kinase
MSDSANNPALQPTAEQWAALREDLAATKQTVESLTAELYETNQGVVALYAELDDKAEQLRQASDLKSRFLSYMSHEFKTPLGSIRSMARILLDKLDGPLTAEQEKQVRFVQGAAVELTEMVNDLLDLAKVEAGRISISPAWFEMVDLFSALRGMFKPIVASDAVSLVFEAPDSMPRVFTDNKKLSQILRNYISNALKFTSAGSVRVSARRNDDETVTFSVADTGIGIPKEHHAALFRDFVQLDSPIQKRLRGTGLGLAICQKFAEILGGYVGIESEPGVGSTFSVTIPILLPGHDSFEQGIESTGTENAEVKP